MAGDKPKVVLRDLELNETEVEPPEYGWLLLRTEDGDWEVRVEDVDGVAALSLRYLDRKGSGYQIYTRARSGNQIELIPGR